MVGDSLYEGVLDRLFPSVGRETIPANSRNVIIKFGGTYVDSEMQILIYGLDSKEERYEIWRLPKGAPSVFRRIQDLGPNARPSDPAVLASSIVVEHRVIKPNDEVSKLARQLFSLNLPLSLDDGITLDGIYYSFYLDSGSNHTHIELIGPHPEWSRSPLIKWMAAMRAVLEGQLESQKN